MTEERWRRAPRLWQLRAGRVTRQREGGRGRAKPIPSGSFSPLCAGMEKGSGRGSGNSDQAGKTSHGSNRKRRFDRDGGLMAAAQTGRELRALRPSVCPSISGAGTARTAKMPQTWGNLPVVMSAASYKSKPRMSSVCVRAPKDLTLPPSLNYLPESGLTCLSSEHYSRGPGRRRCRWIQDGFGANTFASWTGRSWGLIMGRGEMGVFPPSRSVSP